ncbi:MAG: hypothetical protein JWR69_1975, partial [Pedosphaera sp.]|nr:hypothetical protein [Pedosphaera sp.]
MKRFILCSEAQTNLTAKLWGFRELSVEFANAADDAEMVVFANEVSVEADGWAHLAPFGDFPGKGVLKNKDGTVVEFKAIQRMDRQAAEDMVKKFRSPWGKVKRYVTGCWILNGHPDMANAGTKYPDKTPKGMIADLEVRDNGLYCLPVFTEEGKQMVNNNKLFFSGRWSSDPVGEENGKKVYRPDQLKSAGLCDWPNLPVHFVNDKASQETTDPTTDNMKKEIITFLAAHGIEFANDAEDAKVLEALKGIGTKAKTAATLEVEKVQWANDRQSLTATITARDGTIATLTTDRDAHKTNFANERGLRIKGLLDGALTAGTITAAERPDWERRLSDQVNFANEAEALGKTKAAIKTTTVMEKTGERKVEIANAAQRGEALQQLVREEMATNGGNYDAAHATVQRK